MNRFFDCYRRSAFARFFDGLDPIDRQTFWVAVALAFAIAVASTYIVHAAANPLPADPWFELPNRNTQLAAADLS